MEPATGIEPALEALTAYAQTSTFATSCSLSLDFCKSPPQFFWTTGQCVLERQTHRVSAVPGHFGWRVIVPCAVNLTD